MKSFPYCLLLFIFCTTGLFGQLTRNEKELRVEIPGSPKKAELIVLSGATSLPIYFCRVNNHIIMGEYEVINGKTDWRLIWTTGYVLVSDSLKLVDYFDNYRLDQLELFGDQSHNTNPYGATYYKIKKQKNDSVYQIIKMRKVIYEWWGERNPEPYEGVKFPVVDGWWKDSLKQVGANNYSPLLFMFYSESLGPVPVPKD